MLSELQQKNVWENWLSAEMRANYFADMANHYQSWQRALTWLTLIFSSSAALVIVTDWAPQGFEWIKAVLALLTAAVSFLSLVQQNQKSASFAGSRADRCKRHPRADSREGDQGEVLSTCH